MSARRVVAMAAIIGDARGAQQAINRTCTHGHGSGQLALSFRISIHEH
jgi:hypothetical protein